MAQGVNKGQAVKQLQESLGDPPGEIWLSEPVKYDLIGCCNELITASPCVMPGEEVHKLARLPGGQQQK